MRQPVDYCRVVRYRLLADEVNGSRCRSEAVRAALSSEGSATDAALYVLLRAADRFAVTHQRAPGQDAADCEADVPALKALATAILAEVGAQGASAAVTDDLVGACRTLLMSLYLNFYTVLHLLQRLEFASKHMK